jgi:pilus assembly protein CpaC
MFKKSNIASIFIPFVFCLFFSSQTLGEGPERIVMETTSPKKINRMVGHSFIVEIRWGMVNRVEFSAPDIAEAIILTPRQIYIMGKKPGRTNITLREIYDGGIIKDSAIIELKVSPDIFIVEVIIGSNVSQVKFEWSE